jgi:hypothetical protein
MTAVARRLIVDPLRLKTPHEAPLSEQGISNIGIKGRFVKEYFQAMRYKRLMVYKENGPLGADNGWGDCAWSTR